MAGLVEVLGSRSHCVGGVTFGVNGCFDQKWIYFSESGVKIAGTHITCEKAKDWLMGTVCGPDTERSFIETCYTVLWKVSPVYTKIVNKT